MWPERFEEREIAALEKNLGPYLASGRLQQSPAPKGGGLFQRDWWQVWVAADNKFPAFEYVVASLDNAFTSKEESDPSGFTVWGCVHSPRRRQAPDHARRGLAQASGVLG
jgi:hypothetical protein